jgi:hypothetical protein
MTIKEAPQLCVPTFQHGQDLRMGPSIQVNRSYFGSVDSVGAMATTALQAKDDSMRYGSPTDIWTGAVKAATIALDRVQ